MEKGKYAEYLDGRIDFWHDLTFHFPQDQEISIGLPNKFIAPSAGDGIFNRDQFYWDSYFIILGLLESGNLELAKGMVENFAYLQERFGVIPSRNRFFNLGISQPPFFSSMVDEVFKTTGDRVWLAKMVKVIERELGRYWMNGNKNEVAEVHLVYSGLSRYCDHYVNHITGEHESGWDMTSRFSDHCLDYLPVDLNSLLYKYETDLARMHLILGDSAKAAGYAAAGEKRKETVNRLMYNDRKGFFFDYNYKKKRQGTFYSLAGYYPLWVGIATPDQAAKCAKTLKKFEYEWGLANTQKNKLAKNFRQWDYPNGWANQQWIVAKSLRNYGFEDDARRIAGKWVGLNAKVWNKTNKFWEKYNVVRGTVGRPGRYPNQYGFGWTNGVFIKLIKEFDL